MSKNKRVISLDARRRKKQLGRTLPASKRGITLNKLKRRQKNIVMIAILVAIILGIFLVMRPNAYEIKVGEEVLGVVKGEDTMRQSLDIVSATLKDKYKSEVKIVNEPQMKAVRVSKKKLVTPDYLISKIKEHVTYEIGMIDLVIDGKSRGIFKDEASANQLIKDIVAHLNELKNKDVEITKLEAKVELKPVFVPEDSLSDPEEVYRNLTKTSKEIVVYTIASGDNLWGVANKNKMTLQELMELNPEISETSVIQIGQELNVRIDKPVVE